MAAKEIIEIIINAKDAFTAVFGKLDEGLEQAERLSGVAREAVSGLGDALGGVAEQAQTAAEAAEAFGFRVVESQQSVNETLTEMQAEHNMLMGESATAHGERMLEVDGEAEQQRTGTLQEQHDQRLQAQTEYQGRSTSLTSRYQTTTADAERKGLEARLKLYTEFYKRLIALAESQGHSMARVHKAISVANALIDTYRATNSALATVPYPLNFAAAAAVLTEGLANVQKIRQTNTAHGGLDEVPEDATFLLKRGERVLSPGQNRDLIEFLGRSRESAEPAAAAVQNVEIHIMENAAAGETLLRMDSSEWRQVVTEKIIPALDELSALGIRPDFVAESA